MDYLLPIMKHTIVNNCVLQNKKFLNKDMTFLFGHGCMLDHMCTQRSLEVR
jgi:hypothetical protein